MRVWRWTLIAGLAGGCALQSPYDSRVPEPDQPDSALARAAEAPDFAPRDDRRVAPIPPIPLRKPPPPATQTALRTPDIVAATGVTGALPSAAPPQSREPPKLSPEMLVGLSEQETQQLLGLPANVRREPPSTVWNYNAGNCSLDVYFYFDLSTSRFRSLAYELKTARRTDDAQQLCLGDIQGLQRIR